MSVWAGEDVARYVRGARKINPGGVELAPIQVVRLPRRPIFLHGDKRGYLTKHRAVVDHEKAKTKCKADGKGYYHLRPMTLYELRFPRVKVPLTATGFCFPRSTLNRLGIIKLQTAVLDSGYVGEFVQTLLALSPVMFHEDEALVQLVFMQNVRGAKVGYAGRYQGERSI